MKWINTVLIFGLLSFTNAVCHKTTGSKCYKGRLEIKGMCMNYVIKVLDGDTKALNLASRWADEDTGKTYENVFGLSSKCDFPDLEEGAEFYFMLDENPSTDCMVCQAFRPTPAEKNNIKVIPAPCK